MNMVTYSDPPTPVEIQRATSRRNRWLVKGVLLLLALIVSAVRSGEMMQAEQS